MFNTDQQADMEIRARIRLARAEHLCHMTDGRWHDDCRYCLQRRVTGGTGIPAAADQWDFDARLKAAADRATPREQP
jgi:hypothetical protein